mgnify:CR=1 FL=1
MEKQKELEKLLSCVLCKKIFEKNNKPLIMFCGHNICEECKIKNFKKITCGVCNKVFAKREIKKFPINYSILENKNITQTKESNQTENNNTNILSNVSPQVGQEFVSTVIKEVFKHIDEIKIDDNEKEKQIEEIVKKRDLIIKDTYNYLDNLEKKYIDYLNKFFDYIIQGLNSNNEMLINELNISQLLEETGIINFGDMIKLGKFLEMMEDINKDDLLNCSCFEQIYSLIIDKNSEVKYEEFISLFFFFNKIFELKIKKIPKILESQKKIYSNKKECHKNLSHFIFNFVQKYESNLSDIFYDMTTYKSCHFIYDIKKNEKIRNSLNQFYNNNQKILEEYNNIMIIYEPIEKKFDIHIIKIKELKDEKIIDSFLFLTHTLFILTNKKFYIYQIKDKTYSSIDFLENQEIDENSKIIKYDINMFILSSKYFQSINLSQDMTKNDWRSISLFENSQDIIKKPYPITHSSSFIYILDKEKKNINEVFIFNPDADSWDKKEIKLELNTKNDDKSQNKETIIKHNDTEKTEIEEEMVIVKQLFLEDYHLFNKCFACIWGGRHPVSKKFNKNVYLLDAVKGIMKKIINLEDFITDNMIIIDLNVGIIYKYVDFIIVYHLINDEKNVKIKVIRKQIIENDISLHTKLKVLKDINFSEVSFID